MRTRPTRPAYIFPAVPAIILQAVGWLLCAAIVGWVISLPFRVILPDGAAETIGYLLGLGVFAYWSLRHRR